MAVVRGGHLHWIKVFRPQLGSWVWNEILKDAAEEGHQHIVDYCIENGANDWNDALLGSISGGHLSMVKMFAPRVTCVKRALGVAEYCRNVKVVEFLQSLIFFE
jgi:hypothetical protein